MPKSKKRKGHDKKVANRRKKLQDEKNKYMKMQKEALMRMINDEKNKGLFDNPTGIDGPIIDGPSI